MRCRLSVGAVVVVVGVAVATVAALPASGQGRGVTQATQARVERPSISSVLDTLDRVRAFRQTAMSFDGQRLAWVEDASAADGTTAIYVRDLPSGVARRVTAATDGRARKESGIAWSPDGESLAFLSDAGTPGQLQVWRMWLPRGGAVSSGMNPGQLTHVTGQLSHPIWAPDGKTIAVLFVAGST